MVDPYLSHKAMEEAKLCLCPEGDTITTKRLFDALARGCVPVVIGDPIDMVLPSP